MSDEKSNPKGALGGPSNPYRAGHEGNTRNIVPYKSPASASTHTFTHVKSAKPLELTAGMVEAAKTFMANPPTTEDALAIAALQAALEALATSQDSRIARTYARRFEQSTADIAKIAEGVTDLSKLSPDAMSLGGILTDIKRNLPGLPDAARQAAEAVKQAFEESGLAARFSEAFKAKVSAIQ